MVCYTSCWRIILLKIDLHIHSSLSACGADEMSPFFILKQALEKGLNIISITDHNTIEHSLLACKISQKENIKVIPGTELTTREEVHLLAYFDEVSALIELDKLVNRLLPKIDNKPEFFGYQVLYDQHGDIFDLDNKLRQTAINIGLEQLVEEIHRLNGLAIPAHVDKNRFSLLRQLGFIDEKSAFDAVEVSKYKWNKNKYQLGDTLFGFPVICGSDSHYPDDIGMFYMKTEDDRIMDCISFKKYLKEKKHENNSRSSI
ncbi:MAG: PHP domain-containing protein [Atribacterota bacterium]